MEWLSSSSTGHPCAWPPTWCCSRMSAGAARCRPSRRQRAPADRAAQRRLRGRVHRSPTPLRILRRAPGRPHQGRRANHPLRSPRPRRHPRGHRPTARGTPSTDSLFATNNRTAVGAAEALADRPEIGLVGFDDFELAGALRRPVTVVDFDTDEMARHAAEMLFGRLTGNRGKPETRTVPPRLVIRST